MTGWGSDERNIVLIGMSGAGKSTLGVLLAKILGMDFVDTDILIQQREKRLLQQILDQDGEEGFLRIEQDVLSGLQARRSVIATGGSAVYSEKAITELGKTGMIVYLRVGYDEILNRVKNITTRGIVLKKGNSLWDAYHERVPLYESYADITVDCSERDIEHCVREILKKLPA